MTKFGDFYLLKVIPDIVHARWGMNASHFIKHHVEFG